jgi:magnesium-transporting ATPase (P-type)
MNMQDALFDEQFEQEIRPRRRDIMPKWLKIYTWIIIALSIVFFIWTAFFAPDYNANDPQMADPETGASYRFGTKVGHFLPSLIIFMMGILVWLERRRAIRFNFGVAIAWGLLILALVLLSGIQGLLVGMLMPIFIPYWIGLFQIQRKWEKEAVRGSRQL